MLNIVLPSPFLGLPAGAARDLKKNYISSLTLSSALNFIPFSLLRTVNFLRFCVMGLLACHDLVSSILQHAAGTQATTLIGTCCCCCCCGNVRKSTPFKFRQIFCEALDLLQREATAVLSSDPDGIILAKYAVSTSVSSYGVSHPYLVRLPSTLGGGDAGVRSSLCVETGMNESSAPLSGAQQLRIDKKLLLSSERALQLCQELLHHSNADHSSRGGDASRTSLIQDDASSGLLQVRQTGERGGKRLQLWHDVLFLINWDLNDVAVCNLLHLFSRNNALNQAIQRYFTVYMDRFLFAVLRRILTVPAPAAFAHNKRHAAPQNTVSGNTQQTEPSVWPSKMPPLATEQEAFQLNLVRLCLSFFCHLLFRTWASLAFTLEDPLPLLARGRIGTRSQQDESLGNEISSRFCCACCVCSRGALTQRQFCSIHSRGGRALWNVVSKSPGLSSHSFFPCSIKTSEEASNVSVGMKSLLLPGLLMVWRDPRFSFVFPAEFLQSFDSLIHYTHREELQALRRQQRQRTARFLCFPPCSSLANTLEAGKCGDTQRIGLSTILKLGVMSLFLQAEHAIRRGDIKNMEKKLGGGELDFFNVGTGGLPDDPTDTRYLDTARSVTSAAAETLRPFHAAALLRRYGSSRLPRTLHSELAKEISEELSAVLHEEFQVSGQMSDAREAATDFVASVCRWLWGSRPQASQNQRQQHGTDERLKTQEGSNTKDDNSPCPEENESGVWVWQFGSCVNGFCTSVSDVDICVLLPGDATNLQKESSGVTEGNRSTPEEAQQYLYETMLSWHGHNTEYGQAEKAVRLLGEVLERIRIAQSFDEDFEPRKEEQGESGGQLPASQALSEGENEGHGDQASAYCEINERKSCVKVSGIETIHQARVPICRIEFLYGTYAQSVSPRGKGSWSWQPVKAEVSFSNRLAILNSRYIRRLAAQTPLSFTLAAAVKIWAQRRGIANAYRGYLSSYSWLLMAFHFLACRDNPLIHNLLRPLPHVLKQANMSKPAVDFWNGLDNCWFFDPWVSASEQQNSRMKEALRQTTWRNGRHRDSFPYSALSSSSSFSSGFKHSGNGTVDPASNISAAAAVDGGRALAQLLFEFFRFYAYEFNPYSHAISLRYNSPPPARRNAKTKTDTSVWSPAPAVEKKATEEICWWIQENMERASALNTRIHAGANIPFALGFSDLHQGVFLRKMDLALWMGNPRVPIHLHQWKLMNAIPPQPPPFSCQESKKHIRRPTLQKDVFSSLSSDTHKLLAARAAAAICPALTDNETPHTHVVQQRQWLHDWDGVRDEHRKAFLEKYSAVGRKMDILQCGTFVVEDPFRELELLQPKFENHDRLCYELKRATHLLAAASEEDHTTVLGTEANNAREVVETLFRPFDPTVESGMLRFTADASRFMRQELPFLAERGTGSEGAFQHATPLSENIDSKK